jgi:Calcium-dependent channel, 7TM region, putative phosphate
MCERCVPKSLLCEDFAILTARHATLLRRCCIARQVCGFFCEYVLIKMLSGLWIELSRISSLLQHWCLTLARPHATRRDRRSIVMGMRRYDNSGWFNYPKYLAQDLLVVVIAFTFACVNPFILVVSTVLTSTAITAAAMHAMWFTCMSCLSESGNRRSNK